MSHEAGPLAEEVKKKEEPIGGVNQDEEDFSRVLHALVTCQPSDEPTSGRELRLRPWQRIGDRTTIAWETMPSILRVNRQRLRPGFLNNSVGRLADALPSCDTLTELNLAHSGIDIAGVCVLMKTVRNLPLRRLHLGYNTLKLEGTVAVINALAPSTPLSRHLRDLNVTHTYIDAEGFAAVAGMLATNATLLSLDMSENPGRNEGVASLAKALELSKVTCLQTLRISKTFFSEQGAVALANMLMHNTSLKELTLSLNNSCESGTFRLCESVAHNHTLESLCLAANGVTARALKSVGAMVEVNRSLLNLDLRVNHFGGDEVAPLTAALATEATALSTLNLSLCRVGPVGARLLCRALTSPNAALVELKMVNCSLGDGGAKHVGLMLSSNTSLREINLAVNAISHRGAEALAKGLKSNGTLETLILQRNALGDKGVQVVVDTLLQHNNSALRSLDLSYNGAVLSSDSVLLHSFTRLLQHNRKLTSFHVDAWTSSDTAPENPVPSEHAIGATLARLVVENRKKERNDRRMALLLGTHPRCGGASSMDKAFFSHALGHGAAVGLTQLIWALLWDIDFENEFSVHPSRRTHEDAIVDSYYRKARKPEAKELNRATSFIKLV